MRPPGHSGKAKRGHLCFDASFETGNLGRVDLINEHEYDLFIRPDTCSPKLRFWFNFTVDNVRQDQVSLTTHISFDYFAQYTTPTCNCKFVVKSEDSEAKHYRLFFGRRTLCANVPCFLCYVIPKNLVLAAQTIKHLSVAQILIFLMNCVSCSRANFIIVLSVLLGFSPKCPSSYGTSWLLLPYFPVKDQKVWVSLIARH